MNFWTKRCSQKMGERAWSHAQEVARKLSSALGVSLFSAFVKVYPNKRGWTVRVSGKMFSLSEKI